MARRRMIEVSIAHDKKLNALSDFGQLLFLKILPHTDDFGRFEGDPVLVKARADPLSKKPVGRYEAAMREIAAAGLWMWYKLPEGKMVLQYPVDSFERINAFLIKNRGQQEYPPFKKGYELISSDMPAYPIESKEYKAESREYKAESKKQKEEEKIEIPEGLSATWEEFRKHRQEIKKPMTPRAEKMILKELSVLSVGDTDKAVKILEQSIGSGWTSIYGLKDKTNGTHIGSNQQSHSGVAAVPGKYAKVKGGGGSEVRKQGQADKGEN